MSLSASRQEPRISANDLALYMVSSETGKMGILARAKTPPTAPLIRYRDVRPVLVNYLSDPIRRVNPLSEAEQMFQQRTEDAAQSSLVRDDARQSISVIGAIQRLSNQLAGFDFHPAPADQPKLMINGVTVSVRADLILHGSRRGEEQIGAAVLRMTADDASTDAARDKRRNMGLYVATLIRMHLDQNLMAGSNRLPSNRLCLSIDVQHGEAFAAPVNNTRRINDLESACRMITAVWPSI